MTTLEQLRKAIIMAIHKIYIKTTKKSKMCCSECNKYLKVGEMCYSIYDRSYCEKCQKKMGVDLLKLLTK